MPISINGSTGITGVAAIDNVSSTELGYLDGVSSALQTQINGKLTTPGAWTTYTPTFYGLTLGNATGEVRYTQIGKLVVVFGGIVLGTTSSITGPTDMTLPITQRNFATFIPFGVSMYYDTTGANNLSLGTMIGLGNSVVRFITTATNSAYATQTEVSSTQPFTWTTGDQLIFHLMYEAA